MSIEAQITSEEVVAPSAQEKIRCEIDGAMVHAIQAHINEHHAANGWTLERYKNEFPNAPTLSPFAQYRVDLAKAKKAAGAADPLAQAAGPVAQAAVSAAAPAPTMTANYSVSMQHFHEVFDLGAAPAAKNSKGLPIPVAVLNGHNAEVANYMVDTDQDYVFNIDLVKKVIAGIALNKPVYLWGMHGTGKTTVIQQAAARLRRPVMRVQHTMNMEESHVLGQWVVKNGQTEFQLGPLPTAMLLGMIYVADEYDFAMPSVTAVYQPVMEGQALLIKDAPPLLRKIAPHPEFRFMATGNTNGCGDETGLYQGTMMQNAANYSRFGITEEVEYMDAKTEKNILQSKTKIAAGPADKIVKFAGDVRKMFKEGKISMTISPREMINAAQLGVAFGGDWKTGMMLAFANRLPRVDKKVVEEYMQRVFG